MPSRARQVSAAPARRIGSEAFGRSQETAVWWLTNAGFLINARGTILMIDPAISVEPDFPDRSETGLRLLVPLPIEAKDIPRLDAVLYTHGDDDHFARRTAETLSQTKALFVSPPPVASELASMGVTGDRLRAAAVDESFEVGKAKITPTPADHPWQLRDPERFGVPWKPEDCCGYVIDTPDGRIWCPGDTRLMDHHVQMKGVDLLLLDISRSEYHLGVDNAARLANILDVPHIIPYHWGTYDAPDHPAYNGDPAEVAANIKGAENRFHLLAPGERFTL
ncbi:MAG: MBL fold metallo-hydrolase [Armatimonadota bacterium]|nr:MAG: MBL fold metallo-hydrolase [Armatimonadota bacterium]